jgi:DNA polymerase V
MQYNHSVVRFNPFKVNIKAVVRETLSNRRSDVDYNFNIKSANDFTKKTEVIYQDNDYYQDNQYFEENSNSRNLSSNLSNSLENSQVVNRLNLYNSKKNNLNKESNAQSNSFLEGKLDLNQYLVTNPNTNFLIRVKGDSMSKIGINTGDLLIVDRTAKVTNNKIVVAAINGELLVKRILFAENTIQLLSENDQYKPISIRREDSFDIWGVVKSVIKNM